MQNNHKLNITIFGTGYVGLVSGACFAEIGHNVTCCDTDYQKISQLQNSIMPIFEDGLEEIVRNNQSLNRLHFTTLDNLDLSVCDLAVIAVGTPNDPQGRTNLSYVNSVVDYLRNHSNQNMTVMVKSTVPLGTCEAIYNRLNREDSQRKIDVISNPEFLREGSAVKDFLNPERIVLGYRHGESKQLLEKLYSQLQHKTRIIYTDCSTSELTKYASNAFLAAKVAFINEMAAICENIGADIKTVSEAMGLDSRIGSKFLNPGPGFGGSCFPKDVQALTSLTSELNVSNALISAIETSNNNWKKAVAKRVVCMMKEGHYKKVAFWGVTYKASTDDVRSSAAIDIINQLLEHNYQISCYDPEGLKKLELIFGDKIRYSGDKYEVASEAELIVVATEWSEFKEVKFKDIKNVTQKVFFDLRNILNLEQIKKEGVTLNRLGYKNIHD